MTGRLSTLIAVLKVLQESLKSQLTVINKCPIHDTITEKRFLYLFPDCNSFQIQAAGNLLARSVQHKKNMNLILCTVILNKRNKTDNKNVILVQGVHEIEGGYPIRAQPIPLEPDRSGQVWTKILK